MKDKTISPDPPPLSPSLDENQGNSDSIPSESTSVIDDLDIPIATRKGVGSCTQHPISKFVSYIVSLLRIKPLCPILLPCLFLTIYRKHSLIPNGSML